MSRKRLKTYYAALINPCYVCSANGDRPGWMAVDDIDFMHSDAVYPIYRVEAYSRKEAIAKVREIEENRRRR